MNFCLFSFYVTKDDAKYYHTTTNTDHGDEGFVQLFTVDTLTLTNYDTLFISVWAVNRVSYCYHLYTSCWLCYRSIIMALMT